MHPRHHAWRPLAIILAAAAAQLFMQLTFAETSPKPLPLPPPIMGRLTVKGNSPVLLNGNQATTGDTVTSAAIIETPKDTEAIADLGTLGTVELQTGTKVRIDYQCPPDKLGQPDPQSCRVKITLFTGCVISNYKQGSHHEIENEHHETKALSDSDKEKSGGGVLRICTPRNVVAASTAGLGSKRVIAIVAAAIVTPTTLALLAADDDNPSKSTP